ncbi:MAG TPA: c-type cytochrome [Bryobacteraceae bacterium]|jgi:mono/diheme cytochrome c family protein|nr:c-type cytochrome [Bryobacteraceae bacterium]
MNWRKTPIAAVLLAGAVMAGGQEPTTTGKAPPPKYDPASVERGRQFFASTCGFCHGTSAKGGEKGPDLLRSVLVLHDEDGKSIGPVILNGRPDKGMPRFALTANQISDIADFLHNSILSAEDRDSYKILNIVTGDPRAGATYFEGHCTSCHSAAGDLKGIASKYDAITLQGKFIQPGRSWEEGTPPHTVYALSVTVTLPSGESFTGLPTTLDDFTVALRDENGDYHSFSRTRDAPKVEIHNRLQAHMDLVNRYTDDEIHNLTAYLVTLK